MSVPYVLFLQDAMYESILSFISPGRDISVYPMFYFSGTGYMSLSYVLFL